MQTGCNKYNTCKYCFRYVAITVAKQLYLHITRLKLNRAILMRKFLSLDEEEYDELIEISRPSKSLMQQVLTLDLSRQPTYTQALVGGATGW